MAIAERDLYYPPVPNEPESFIDPALYPLDKKILGGVALSRTVGPVLLSEVKTKLEIAFDVMRSDMKVESGACIAYGYNLSAESQDQIDEALLTTAEEQNHGMLTQANIDNSHRLWVGRDGNRVFALHKHVGPIILSNYTAPTGIVYGLLGHVSR